MKYAAISIDVDGAWAQERHWKDIGHARIGIIKRDDPVLKEGIAEALDFLSTTPCTFFLVGENVLNYPSQHKAIVKKGHEVASHSFSHDPSFSALTREEKTRELEDAEDAISRTLGIHPSGFRAPNYSIDDETLDILSDKGYLYDSSFIPAFLPGYSPLKSLLSKKAPHKKRGLIEIPVSACGPFPLMGTAAINLGKGYFDVLSTLTRNRPLIINFHVRDFVQIRKGAWWIRPLSRRRQMIGHIIRKLKKDYRLVKMKDIARRIR